MLDIVQDSFPLVSAPYREMASVLDVSEDDFISRLKRLKDDGIIRRMGAIFDSKKLGYSSTLCAMKVPDQRVDEVAQIVNEYIGVTHNYVRNHEYNVWFTITAKSRQELDKIEAEIRERSGIDDLIDLPAIRLFKIRVRFAMLNTAGNTSPETQESGQKEMTPRVKSEVSEFEKRIVRELQGDIPLSQRPFKIIAHNLGVEEEQLLTKLRELKAQGVMRRISAILRHRNLGISANGMGAWRVPEDKAEEIGKKMAEFSEVSHCYQRPSYPDWPYNLFTMIHGRTRQDCQQVAESISQATGIENYRLLYSTRELKKVSMKYFTEKDNSYEESP